MSVRMPSRMPTPPTRPSGQRGFAMITVVFLVVILAAVVAAVAGLRERGAQATVLELRQVQAAQAARTGLEWAAWKVRDPSGTATPGASDLPPCFASPATLTLPGSLEAFELTVTCTRTPALTDSPPHYLEDVRRLVVYTLTAVATAGAVDTPDRVERRMQMRVETCKDPASPAVNYAC